MSVSWTVRGVPTDYDPEDPAWANHHNEGASRVIGALGLGDDMVGEIRGRELIARVNRALAMTDDPDLVRRLIDLVRVARVAGELGLVSYG